MSENTKTNALGIHTMLPVWNWQQLGFFIACGNDPREL